MLRTEECYKRHNTCVPGGSGSHRDDIASHPGPNGGLWTDSFANFKLILKLNERFSKVKREKTHLSPSYYYQLKDDEIPVN